MKGNSLFGAIRAFFVYSDDDAGNQLTGVARYLREHNIEPKPKEKTSVDRYLDAREADALIAEADEAVEVEEFIAEDCQQAIELEQEALVEESEPVSPEPVYQPAQRTATSSGGLLATIRSFFVYDNGQSNSHLTGVERYLQENFEPEPELDVECEAAYDAELRAEATTGVARYLEQSGSDEAPMCVAADVVAEAMRVSDNEADVEYQAETELAAEVTLRSEATTGVAKYLEQSDSDETRINVAAELVAEAVMVLEAVDSESAALERELQEVDEVVESVSGVDRYMVEQASIESELPLITGVDMYLQDQAALSAERAASTSVGEYLDEADLQSQAAAILAKYQESEAQAEVEVEQVIQTSSVADYIEANIIAEAEASTGVGGYLDKSAKIAAAGGIIANFLARQQALAEAALPAPSSVAQYLDRCEQSAANESDSGVNVYLEKAAVDAKVAEIITGFHERMRIANQQQQALALEPAEDRVSVVKIRHRKASGVARYITQADSGVNEPSSSLSGVDRFMKEQELITKEKAAADIISRYLARQEAANAPQEVLSSVAIYIAELAERGPLLAQSGVSQYLINRPAATVSEAIPVLESSVSRYLNDQGGAVDEPKLTTKVDQYLANQIIEASNNPVAKPSGVDRYVLSQEY